MRYIPDQYKTQQMCDEAVDDCLAALKFVPGQFVTSKIIKIPLTGFYTHENILYFNEDSSNVVFTCNRMGILNIGLNNDDPDTIILVRLLVWHVKFEIRKALKKR